MDYKTKKCLVCGKDFKPATANARYCSDECRKTIAKRNSTQQATKNKLDRQLQREAEKKSENTPPPPKTPAPPETPPETPAPPEIPPETVPPTETTTPLNSESVPEDKGESGSKPFRKFFYD